MVPPWFICHLWESMRIKEKNRQMTHSCTFQLAVLKLNVLHSRSDIYLKHARQIIYAGKSLHWVKYTENLKNCLCNIHLLCATLNLNNHFLLTVRCNPRPSIFLPFSSLYYAAIVSNIICILWLCTILPKQTFHNKILHNVTCILWLCTILPKPIWKVKRYHTR